MATRSSEGTEARARPQRAFARQRMMTGAWRTVLAIIGLAAFGWMISGMTSVFPVLVAGAFGALGLLLLNGMTIALKSLGPLLAVDVGSTAARIEPGEPGDLEVALVGDGRTFKIHRAAFMISEAPFAKVATWEFKVYFAQWNGSLLTVRPVGG